jgi:hypothetical protein
LVGSGEVHTKARKDQGKIEAINFAVNLDTLELAAWFCIYKR